MIIDGRALAAAIVADLRAETAAMTGLPLLTVFTCAPNFETKKFLDLKTKRAAEAGISVSVIELPPTVTLEQVAVAIKQYAAMSDGIIIQFPFPYLMTKDLIDLIPSELDVDVTHYDGQVEGLLPPVVGAVAEISQAHAVDWTDKAVAVVGNGRLVGAPAAMYATSRGAVVTVVTKDSNNISATKDADIIILGAGSPGLLTSEMLKEGAVVFDAGTSEEGGMLVGDAHPEVATKASLFTPVPGGIGPLTIAILLKNVLYLAKQHRK
jgi:methylenetetrahydrofolate dehydrogenase (NADP+)/methenyltetrahydrofolate cyclohydrolase